MIRPDQIPDAVVEAAAKELAHTNGWRNQQGIEVCKPVALELIAAALNAWPGLEYRADVAFPAFGHGPKGIVLPLPQKDGDE